MKNEKGKTDDGMGGESGATGVGGIMFDKDLDHLSHAIQENRPEHEEEILDDPGNEEDRQTKPGEPKFSEKKIRNMIRAPFELAYIITGNPGNRLLEPEINLILEDTVDIMNELVSINPLWLAAFGLAVNGGAIVINKINGHKKWKAERARPVEEKQQ